jgi:hypothetical protein
VQEVYRLVKKGMLGDLLVRIWVLQIERTSVLVHSGNELLGAASHHPRDPECRHRHTQPRRPDDHGLPSAGSRTTTRLKRGLKCSMYDRPAVALSSRPIGSSLSDTLFVRFQPRAKLILIRIPIVGL